MQRRVPDIHKIKTKLGWQPTHNLDSIIDDVAKHLK
jgi:UDP-glucose 4-epimerase